jgi:uncharacterized Fe-S center protein
MNLHTADDHLLQVTHHVVVYTVIEAPEEKKCGQPDSNGDNRNQATTEIPYNIAPGQSD